MTGERAIEMIENGEARLIETSLVVLRVNTGVCYISFDGKKWAVLDEGIASIEFSE